VTARKRRVKQPSTVAVEQTKRSAVLYGPVRVIHPVLRRLAVPWQFDHRRRAYLVPVQRIDDVMVGIELDGHNVDYRSAALW
jgi:hypothetical protein